jgi:hypothetical protein
MCATGRWRGGWPLILLCATPHMRAQAVYKHLRNDRPCVGVSVCVRIYIMCGCVCVFICVCVCIQKGREREREIATWQGGNRSGRARNTCVATAGMANSWGAISRAAA